jgi:hypothetical protein
MSWKNEINYKYTCTTGFFKPLMDINKDEILKEVLVTNSILILN